MWQRVEKNSRDKTNYDDRGKSDYDNSTNTDSFSSYQKKYDAKMKNNSSNTKQQHDDHYKQRYKQQRETKSVKKPPTIKPFVNPLYVEIHDEKIPSDIVLKMRDVAHVEPEMCGHSDEYYTLRANTRTGETEYSEDGMHFVPWVGQPFPDIVVETINLHVLNHYVDEDDPYYIDDSMIEAYYDSDVEEEEEEYFSQEEY